MSRDASNAAGPASNPRGKIPGPRGARNVRQLVSIKRGRHSEKPAEVRRRIDEMFPELRKIELFARGQARTGWTVWESNLMAREHLEERDNWQDDANRRGQTAELEFSDVMRDHLAGTSFSIEDKPRELATIYGRNRGIHPDHALRNRDTNKSIYVEIKRQRARGNAHERACKYMMPGILLSSRRHAKQPNDVIPVWWVFTGGIATNDRYRREIMHWFLGVEHHVLLWKDRSEASHVTDHFDRHIRQLLI